MAIQIENIEIIGNNIKIRLYEGITVTSEIITDIQIKNIKCDGLFIIILDVNNNIFQYHYDSYKKKFIYSKFVRMPFLRRFFHSAVNIKPLTDNLWSVQRYKPKDLEYSVETVFSKETTDNNIKIYDPWVDPRRDFTISYPSDIVPIVIDSSHATLALLTSDRIYYRRVNFDFAGYNPLMKYTYNGKTIIHKFMYINEIEINTSDFIWKSIEVPYNTYNICVIDDILYAYNGVNYFIFISEWQIYYDTNWHYKFSYIINRPLSPKPFINKLLSNNLMNSEPFYSETKDEYILKMIPTIWAYLKGEYKYITIKK